MGGAGRMELCAGTEAGVYKPHILQLFIALGIDISALALVIGAVGAAQAAPLVPIQPQEPQVLFQQVCIDAGAAGSIQILDAQQDASPLAFGAEPGQQAAGQIAQVQPSAGAGGKAPGHPAHRLHWPSAGCAMGVL